jgi:FkbM family methyltransferase
MLERVLVAYAKHFPIRRGKLRIIDQFWRLATRDGGRNRMAVLNRGGFVVPCDLADMLQRQYYFFGTYFIEDFILDRWSEAAKKAPIVFDIGANAGIYSLAALASRPDAAVHAFEPTPEIAARLRTAAELNHLQNLFVHEFAVSDKSGTATLWRCRGDRGDNEGMNFIGPYTGAPGIQSVATVSLDDFCRERGIERVDLAKIDVQGHEPAVLEGARRLIASRRIETIFLELNWTRALGAHCPATACIDRLAGAGYKFSSPHDCGTWRDAGVWLRSLGDVVARCNMI